MLQDSPLYLGLRDMRTPFLPPFHSWLAHPFPFDYTDKGSIFFFCGHPANPPPPERGVRPYPSRILPFVLSPSEERPPCAQRSVLVNPSSFLFFTFYAKHFPLPPPPSFHAAGRDLATQSSGFANPPHKKKKFALFFPPTRSRGPSLSLRHRRGFFF